ncbi:MAG: DUF1937 family protein [Chloroflexi bacterium]|nr:DUF1937 family protein [Chloroflexota bacterium]
MIYLASPYSHDDPVVCQERYDLVCKAAAMLMHSGARVFSPIAHSHHIAEHIPAATGFNFWQGFDFEMLATCSLMIILTLDGWASSVGIQAEIAQARLLNIPVMHLSLTDATRRAKG